MPGKRSEDGQMEVAAVEDGGDEGLGGLTVEELQQGQETALALEDMMALSAQTLVRTEVEELYEEVRPLGQGRFGRVLLVTHRQKGTRSRAQARHRVHLPGETSGKLSQDWGVITTSTRSSFPTLFLSCVFYGVPLTPLSLSFLLDREAWLYGVNLHNHIALPLRLRQ